MILLLRRILNRNKSKRVVSDGETYMSDNCFQITIENVTDTPLNARLFGPNYNMLLSNYGSDSGIKISGPESYLKMIMSTQHSPLMLSLIRVMTLNGNLPSELYIRHIDVNGQNNKVRFSINTDVFCNQVNIVDVPCRALIDANSHIELAVPANTKLVFKIFFNPKINSYGTTTCISGVPLYNAPIITTANTF